MRLARLTDMDQAGIASRRNRPAPPARPARLVLALLALVVLAGCARTMATGEPDDPGESPAAPLTGTRWVVDRIVTDGTARSAPADAEAYLTLTETGDLTGSTGCNRMGGQVAITARTLDFSPLVTTKMACAGPADALERAVVATLRGSVRYAVEGRRLTLAGPAGQGLRLVADA